MFFRQQNEYAIRPCSRTKGRPCPDSRKNVSQEGSFTRRSEIAPVELGPEFESTRISAGEIIGSLNSGICIKLSIFRETLFNGSSKNHSLRRVGSRRLSTLAKEKRAL